MPESLVLTPMPKSYSLFPYSCSSERLIPTHILYNTHTVYVYTYVQTIIHIHNTLQTYWSLFSLVRCTQSDARNQNPIQPSPP